MLGLAMSWGEYDTPGEEAMQTSQMLGLTLIFLSIVAVAVICVLIVLFV
jgi:hypothetical protein